MNSKVSITFLSWPISFKWGNDAVICKHMRIGIDD
jgi:hypothetical protein